MSCREASIHCRLNVAAQNVHQGDGFFTFSARLNTHFLGESALSAFIIYHVPNMFMRSLTAG
ncbi:MAG TPA: hypothetical protein DD440_04820 [Porticoccaceae bacterium]|nr:hypothetical protein [Porticoccaceae bacterium]